jgi:hypothetical protein
MATVTIDNVEYDLDSLSDNARTQINNLHATEAELNRQQALVSMLQAARLKYRELLKAEMAAMVDNKG